MTCTSSISDPLDPTHDLLKALKAMTEAFNGFGGDMDADQTLCCKLALAEAEAAIAKAEEQEIAGSWNSIATCPIREPVDLWCVYGGEEFAQYDTGASIGKLVSNRYKTEEYGFLGRQSKDGVPQGNALDLIPVAWRKAVPQCPSKLIAEVLGIPMTSEDAIALIGGDDA